MVGLLDLIYDDVIPFRDIAVSLIRNSFLVMDFTGDNSSPSRVVGMVDLTCVDSSPTRVAFVTNSTGTIKHFSQLRMLIHPCDDCVFSLLLNRVTAVADFGLCNESFLSS